MKTTNKTLRKLQEKRYIYELEILKINTTVKYFLSLLFDVEDKQEKKYYVDNPPYQRGYVWTLKQKQEYIYNLFKGMAKIEPTIAVYYSADYKDTYYEVVDGKQRISTIIEYLDNKFPIVFENEEIYFDNLQDEDKKYFYKLKVDYTRIMHKTNINEPINQEYILDIFIEMNLLGTKMTDKDFNRVYEIKNNINK